MTVPVHKHTFRIPLHLLFTFLFNSFLYLTNSFKTVNDLLQLLISLKCKSPYTHFWNSHSRLSRGQTWRVFSQREMQWKWKACWTQHNNTYHHNTFSSAALRVPYVNQPIKYSDPNSRLETLTAPCKTLQSYLRCTLPKLLCTPHLLLMLDLPDTRCLQMYHPWINCTNWNCTDHYTKTL